MTKGGRPSTPHRGDETRMRIAIVDEELPYPPNSGKRIRTFQLVSRLADRHRITYICHRNADARGGRPGRVRVLPTWGSRRSWSTARSRPSRARASTPGLAANLLSPLPYSVATHTSRRLRRAIRGLAAHARDRPLAGRVDAVCGIAPGAGRRPPVGHGPQRRVADLAAVLRERGTPAAAVVHRPPVAEIPSVRAHGRSARRIGSSP